MDNQHIGDNHNAPVFYQCYKRMGEFIPQLVGEGKQPRAMLEYSGCLFHGLQQMGSHDLFEALRTHDLRSSVSPLRGMAGLPLGACGGALHPGAGLPAARPRLAAPLRRPVRRRRLDRVRGFSPSEMALPNQPDVAYEFVKTLRDCGFHWVMVQEHTVETPRRTWTGTSAPCSPSPGLHQLRMARPRASSPSIKTQGSDTKLVAQMQPYYEAKGWTAGSWPARAFRRW